MDGTSKHVMGPTVKKHRKGASYTKNMSGAGSNPTAILNQSTAQFATSVNNTEARLRETNDMVSTDGSISPKALQNHKKNKDPTRADEWNQSKTLQTNHTKP